MDSSLKSYHSDACGGEVSGLALDTHHSVTVSIATNEPERAPQISLCRFSSFEHDSHRRQPTVYWVFDTAMDINRISSVSYHRRCLPTTWGSIPLPLCRFCTKPCSENDYDFVAFCRWQVPHTECSSKSFN